MVSREIETAAGRWGFARVAQGLAPTEVGTEKPVERGWGATGKPELHGLPRNLVAGGPGRSMR